MKTVFVVLITLLFAAAVAPAMAHEGDTCAHDTPTIEALRDCVVHAQEHGHIDNQGITQSLLALLDAAQAALDQGQTSAAIDALNAFIHLVEAQSGKHIVAEHASHLVEHAQLVIDALGG